MKKIIGVLALALFFFTGACGTLLKSNQMHKAHSNKLDTTIVVLDAIGVLFGIIPGVVAFAIDYSNGTLYLPAGHAKLEDTSLEGIQRALNKNGYNVTVEQLKQALRS